MSKVIEVRLEKTYSDNGLASIVIDTNFDVVQLKPIVEIMDGIALCYVSNKYRLRATIGKLFDAEEIVAKVKEIDLYSVAFESLKEELLAGKETGDEVEENF